MKIRNAFTALALVGFFAVGIATADDAAWKLVVEKKGSRLQSVEWVKGEKRVDALTPELLEKIAGQPKCVQTNPDKTRGAAVIPGFDEDSGIVLLLPGETAEKIKVSPEPMKVGVADAGVFYVAPSPEIGFLQINFLPFSGPAAKAPLMDRIPLGRYEQAQVTVKFEKDRAIVDIDRKRSILIPEVGRKDGGEVLDEMLSGEATQTLSEISKTPELVADTGNSVLSLQTWMEPVSKQVENILVDKPRRSVLVIGKVGAKSEDVVRHLARRIGDGSVRKELQGWKIYKVNPAVFGPDGTVGGQDTKNEAWLRSLRHQKVILFIEGIERLTQFGGDSREESKRIPIAIAPYFNSGYVRVIATTSTEGKVDLDTVPELSRTFETLPMPTFTADEVTKLVKQEISKHTGDLSQKIEDRNLKLLVALTVRQLEEKPQPDVTLEAASELIENAKGRAVTSQEIKAWVAQRSGRASLSSEKLREFLKEENFLKAFDKYFIGAMDTRRAALEALRQQLILILDRDEDLSDIDTRASQGLGKLMYIGPSGVGKTFIPELLEKLLAERGINWPAYWIKGNEYGDEKASSRLFGSETSYVGFDRAGGPFYRAVKEFPERIVIADEFDKFHTKVAHYFYDILDNGKVPDAGVNRFAGLRGLIILNGNFGSRGTLQDPDASIEEQEVSSLLDEFALWYYDQEYTFRKANPEIVKKYFADLDKNKQTLPQILGKVTDRLFQVYEKAGRSMNSQIMRRVGKFVVIPHFSLAETRELIRRTLTAYAGDFASRSGATVSFAPELVTWFEKESWGDGGNRVFRYGADGLKAPKSAIKAAIAELGTRPGIQKKKFTLTVDPKKNDAIVVQEN